MICLPGHSDWCNVTVTESIDLFVSTFPKEKLGHGDLLLSQ